MQTWAANGDDVGVRRWLRGQARRVLVAVRDTEASLVVYGKLLFGKRIVAASTIIAAALTAVDAFRGSHDQLLLSARWWLIISAAGVMLAQFLVWRDLWIDNVDEPHGQSLREIAKHLQSQLAADNAPTYDDSLSWVPQHTFRAHFPTLATDINFCQQAFEDKAQALRSLIDAVDLAVFTEFGLDVGWYQGAISQRCKTHLDDIIERRALDITVSPSADLIWVVDVVYDGPEPQEAERRLRHWLLGVADWQEVTGYRDARARKARSQVHALYQIDPLLHEEPIRKARGCKICFPSRKHR